MQADHRKAGLPEREVALLDLVEKLTRRPMEVTDGDRDALRSAGWSDDELFYAVLGCAHFNYLNRMADGLGIRLEYETSLPPFEVRDGSRRGAGSANAGTSSPRPGALPSGPGGEDALVAALAREPEIAALVREWRAHVFRPSPGLGAAERLRLAMVASGVEEPGSDRASRDGVLSAHADRLARRPWTVTEAHIDALRAAGLDDTAVLQLTALVAYVSFEGRVCAGLGVSGR